MTTPLAARFSAATLLLLAPLLGGCGDKQPMSYRSGTVTDDYVEGPLMDDVKGYENALRVSNSVLDMLKAGDAKGVYELYIDPRLQQKATAEQFAMPIQVTIKKFGPIQQYKPMQWGFAHAKADGLTILYVTKLVEHERGMLRYHFQFEDDGKYAKLIGIDVKARKGVAPPGPP
jgi:hypothetical protein